MQSVFSMGIFMSTDFQERKTNIASVVTDSEKDDCLHFKSEARMPCRWISPTWSKSQLWFKHSNELHFSFQKIYPPLAHLQSWEILDKRLHSEHTKSLLCQSKSTWKLPSIYDWEMTCSMHAFFILPQT